MLSAFATNTALALLAELGVNPNAIVTLDALHCPKTVRMRSRGQSHPDRSSQRQPAQPTPALPRHCGRGAGRSLWTIATRKAATATSAAPLASLTQPTALPERRGTPKSPPASATHRPPPSAPPWPSGRAGHRKHLARRPLRDPGKDRSRIRDKPGVFDWLRSFAFNINKASRSGTMNQDRYRATLAGFETLPQFREAAER